MLSRKYSPETVCAIVDEFATAIYALDKIAKVDVKLENFRNEIYGRIIRSAPAFTKAQIKRWYTERDFNLANYIHNLEITQSYVRVSEFPVNLKTGRFISAATPFRLHDQEDNPLDKAQHNLITRYQATLLLCLLVDVLNQYLTMYFNQPTTDTLEYRNSFAEKEITFLTAIEYDARVLQSDIMNRMSNLALYTDYEKELVKLIVSTRFLNLTMKNEQHHCTVMCLDKFIDHEYASPQRHSHEKIMREQILSKLAFESEIVVDQKLEID